MLRPKDLGLVLVALAPPFWQKEKMCSGCKKTHTFHFQVPEAALGVAVGVSLGRGHSPCWCQLAWVWGGGS